MRIVQHLVIARNVDYASIFRRTQRRRFAALRRLTSIQTQPEDADEAALIRRVAEDS